MYYSAPYSSPLGKIMLVSDGRNLVGLWIEGQKYYAASLKEDLAEKPQLPVLAAAAQWLDAYFAGRNPAVSALPLAPGGSDFRRAVWDILCRIPYGEYTTYGQIAKEMAARMNKTSMSGQAIGGAVGHNPISIIIPCHRVVGSNKSLTGYAGGLEKKKKLLELEGLDLSQFSVPRKGSAL